MRFLMLNWRDPKNPLAGGAERVTEGYLAALRARGHEVYWFAFAFEGAPAEEELRGLRIIRGGGKGTAILAAWRWYRRQPRFDLVVDQHHGLPWFAPWWCRTHCVAYIHEVLGPIWNAFYRPLTAAVGRFQERWTHWLYRNVPFWTASACTKTQLEAHGVRRVHLIPYGVDTRALPKLPDKPLVPPLRLIVVSRLAPNKRVDHAIRAYARLREQGVDARLTIVGGGVDEAKLHALAAAVAARWPIEFTGPLPEAEKDARLREAHLLLHTSLREGWGLNVIEANALGTPAVVYPVPGLIESTLHDQTGVVVPSETPEALADAIAALLRAPARYQRYRVAAWERAKTFHWSHVLPVACNWLEAMARGESSATPAQPACAS